MIDIFSAEVTSIEQLPLPKPVVKAPLTEAAMAAKSNSSSSRPEVRIADQIAIRSFVLGHKLPKIGKESSFILNHFPTKLVF